MVFWKFTENQFSRVSAFLSTFPHRIKSAWLNDEISKASRRNHVIHCPGQALERLSFMFRHFGHFGHFSKRLCFQNKFSAVKVQ
jgi:hypothetical protein